MSGEPLPWEEVFYRPLNLPASSDLFLREPDLCLAWDQDITGGRLSHSITLQRAAGANLPENALRRLLCYIAIAHLPESALSEALDSLGEIYEYYRTLPLVRAPTLPPPYQFRAGGGTHTKHRPSR